MLFNVEQDFETLQGKKGIFVSLNVYRWDEINPKAANVLNNSTVGNIILPSWLQATSQLKITPKLFWNPTVLTKFSFCKRIFEHKFFKTVSNVLDAGRSKAVFLNGNFHKVYLLEDNNSKMKA